MLRPRHWCKLATGPDSRQSSRPVGATGTTMLRCCDAVFGSGRVVKDETLNHDTPSRIDPGCGYQVDACPSYRYLFSASLLCHGGDLPWAGAGARESTQAGCRQSPSRAAQAYRPHRLVSVHGTPSRRGVSIMEQARNSINTIAGAEQLAQSRRRRSRRRTALQEKEALFKEHQGGIHGQGCQQSPVVQQHQEQQTRPGRTDQEAISRRAAD